MTRQGIEFRKFAAVVLVLTLCLVTGCKSTLVPIRYYLIDPVEFSPLRTTESLSIQIIDLKIPQYLERFQIATRSGANQLTFSDDHQWAENLRKNLDRTLARNLGQLLNTADVGTPQNRSLSAADFKVRVSIDQFELDESSVLILSARYQVLDGEDLVLLTKHFEASEADVNSSHVRIVRAMRGLFGELSEDVAASLNQLAGGS